ncbi:acyl-CoA carboxylase subunit epsilon [Herbiconiux sp. CPCC 205763]|uniref:Acyl-CoA carboxylase subunit epsilon n=1 Tax=Herbiconiux aconitum TaxID=2970913 RepID=A0ABT2GKF9_9MICO|nr:acyl-CoA carboxylase subunit epsilon [Herbiconiux aconitum]MCS5716648.1 acyl-CoA carboxylase subunit epsilon [Herbiconiux aconitum]
MNDEDSTSAEQPALQVLTTGISHEELAAVTAVVESAVADELAELHDDVQIGPSAWQRSQRSMRSPVHPGPSAWRSFSGIPR